MNDNDKLAIKLRLGNEMREMVIERDNEKYYREGSRMINELFNKYSQHFQNLPDAKYLSSVALEIAIRYLKDKDKNESEPYLESIASLTEEIESALGENK